MMVHARASAYHRGDVAHVPWGSIADAPALGFVALAETGDAADEYVLSALQGSDAALTITHLPRSCCLEARFYLSGSRPHDGELKVTELTYLGADELPAGDWEVVLFANNDSGAHQVHGALRAPQQHA